MFDAKKSDFVPQKRNFVRFLGKMRGTTPKQTARKAFSVLQAVDKGHMRR